jgi:hypothetical protein
MWANVRDRYSWITRYSSSWITLLLPLALKTGAKTFFKKDIRYFTCFWIVLILSMILSGVVSTLFPLPV